MLQWLMQDPKASQTRKPWYQRAMQMATPWRSTVRNKPSRIPPNDNNPAWKALSKTTSGEVHTLNGSSFRRPQKMRKCSSLRAATSFTRVCLCGTISSYNEVFRAEYVPPRRSYSYPGSKPVQGQVYQERGPAGPTTSPRPSIEICRSRAVFRGKSLRDDVLRAIQLSRCRG